jgi:hypothetical protein
MRGKVRKPMARFGGRWGGGLTRLGVAPEVLGGLDDVRRVDAAGDAEDQAMGAVPGVDVVHQVAALNGGDAVEIAGDVPADGLVAVGGVGEEAEGALAGLVVGAADLLLDDGALALDFGGVEQGVAQAVGEDVEGEVEAVEGDAVPEAGELLAGEGVEGAAGAFDGGADLAGAGAGRRALEQHVFEVVRETEREAGLGAAADTDVHGAGGGLRVVERGGDDAQPVGQRCDGPGGLGRRHHGCSAPILVGRSWQEATTAAWGRRGGAAYAATMAQQFIPARYEWHWTSLVGAVQGALRHFELPWESSWVSAGLGEAFAVVDVDAVGMDGRAFGRLGTPPSPLDGLGESLRALGLGGRVHVRDLPRQRKPWLLERRLKLALNAERPALAYGAGVSVGLEAGGTEWGLIVGYDDERASYRVDGPLTAEAGPWLRFDALGGAAGDAARRLAVATLSKRRPSAARVLGRAVAAARSAGAADRLQAWAALLESEAELDAQGHAYRAQQLAGSRGEAARFWHWVADGAPGVPEAGAVAEAYAASALALSTFATLFPYPMGGDVHGTGARDAGARALRRAAEAEGEAVARLAAIRASHGAALRPPART